jgi:hypothetical protein
MAWNGLNSASVIRPEQKLLLRVTPPVTSTPTQTPSPTTIAASPSPSMTQPLPTETPSVVETETSPGSGLWLIFGVVVVAIGGLSWWRFSRKN